jgi:hypothetical protein
MKSELRRRIESLEDRYPTASATVDGNADGMAFDKATAFVSAHGGRRNSESWAAALARVVGITNQQLMSDLRARAEGAQS